MAKKPLPSPELLRQLLRYEPETGKLFWLKRTPEMFCPTQKRTAEHLCALWNSKNAGNEALTFVTSRGYKYGKVFGRCFMAHRIVWAISHGDWPTNQIDHVNGVKDDNRLENLRCVTNRQNSWNTGSRRNSKSSMKGVSWNNRVGKWAAQIKVGSKNKHIGYFDCEVDAAKAYSREASKVQGVYAWRYDPLHVRRA